MQSKSNKKTVDPQDETFLITLDSHTKIQNLNELALKWITKIQCAFEDPLIPHKKIRNRPRKRSAGNEFTHDNWQDEEEPEEVGVFKKDNEKMLKDRPKITAERGTLVGKISTITGCSEFGSLKSSTSPSTFSFLANVT
jgi:hypothetical protein